MLLTRKCMGTDRDRVKGRGYQNWLQCYDGKFVVPIFLTKRRISHSKTASVILVRQSNHVT